MAGDADLERNLTTFYAGPLVEHHSRLVALQLSCCHELVGFDEYRTLRDSAEWRLMLALRDALACAEELDAPVFAWDGGAVRLLDGFHRLSALRDAARAASPAYELIGWRYHFSG